MKKRKMKCKVGIIGCGAIGSRMAKSIRTELRQNCSLCGLLDIDTQKAIDLSSTLFKKSIVKHSLREIIRSSDFIVEAVNSQDTAQIVRQSLKAKKNILVMSAGKILNSPELFDLARKNKCTLLIPSGAIGGLDAIKAASQVKFSHISLTTRKPPSGFLGSAFLKEKGINVSDIDSETVIYDGDVDQALRLFSENINVAATLALASQCKDKIQIRIIASPEFKTNSHEIEASGEFGKITIKTENVICPDNPKTSYLAVLSAIQTLKQFFNTLKIGT